MALLETLGAAVETVPLFDGGHEWTAGFEAAARSSGPALGGVPS